MPEEIFPIIDSAVPDPDSMEQAVAERRIDVAICTFRRESLATTIRSVASQALPSHLHLRVIVADNDTTPSARALVDALQPACLVPIHYVHAPAQNISVARNACLDAVDAEMLAFIDDDEVASPDWIGRLVTKLDNGGADIVLGPAIAQYPPDAPGWVVAADLHSTHPVVRDGRILTGYTCNVLFRTAAIGDLRFDPRLGRTGGEDDVFFATLTARGAIVHYAADASVLDPVPMTRLKLAWLMRRAFRNGQTYARITISRGKSRILAAPFAAAKALACFAIALSRSLSPVGWRKGVVRAALHCGAIAYYCGVPELRLY